MLNISNNLIDFLIIFLLSVAIIYHAYWTLKLEKRIKDLENRQSPEYWNNSKSNIPVNDQLDSNIQD